MQKGSVELHVSADAADELPAPLGGKESSMM